MSGCGYWLKGLNRTLVNSPGHIRSSNFCFRRIGSDGGDSMARRGPQLLRWLALAVLAVSLAACSSNPKTAPSSSASHAASSGATTTSSPITSA